MGYCIWMSGKASVELYIDTGNKEENKRIFDALFLKKQKIEDSFKEELSWERLDEKRSCRVRFVLEEGGLTDEPRWPVIQEAMISAMDKLAKAVLPHLKKT